MDINRQERFEAMLNLARRNTRILEGALRNDMTGRWTSRKADDTGITPYDYRIGLLSAKYIQRRFPGDSIHDEEIKFINPHARYWFFEDPIEDSYAFSRHKPEGAGGHAAAPSYMCAYVDRGDWAAEDDPFAFCFGMPLMIGESGSGEIYAGSTDTGITLDGKPFSPPLRKSDIVVGLNETEQLNFSTISKHIGFTWKEYGAGTTLYLLLNRFIGGAYLHYRKKNVEELACIAAAANCLGAKVTLDRGRPFRLYQNEPDPWERLIISFSHLDHRELARKKIVRIE